MVDNQKLGMGWLSDLSDFRGYTLEHEEAESLED